LEKSFVSAEKEKKLSAALDEALGFIRRQLVCLGERHDCPSCNGQDAHDTLADIAVILSPEGKKDA
jgi:hypothetical protein